MMLSRRKAIAILSSGVIGTFIGKLFGQSKDEGKEINIDLRRGKYCVVYERETKRYYNGKLHCIDGPAVEYADGDKFWYQNGKLHRDDGPALITDKCKQWIHNGELHRINGPAVEWNNGRKEWWVKGELKYNNYATVNYKSLTL